MYTFGARSFCDSVMTTTVWCTAFFGQERYDLNRRNVCTFGAHSFGQSAFNSIVIRLVKAVLRVENCESESGTESKRFVV